VIERLEIANAAGRRCFAGSRRQAVSDLWLVFHGNPLGEARVFQAYGCRYAMLLDMNALEHTYLVVYQREGSKLLVQHLIQGMSVLDQSGKGNYIPRFIGYADDRDFFMS
jgi:hypothetical protein